MGHLSFVLKKIQSHQWTGVGFFNWKHWRQTATMSLCKEKTRVCFKETKWQKQILRLHILKGSCDEGCFPSSRSAARNLSRILLDLYFYLKSIEAGNVLFRHGLHSAASTSERISPEVLLLGYVYFFQRICLFLSSICCLYLNYTT